MSEPKPSFFARRDLWEQVYTRTLANIISVGVIAVLAVASGQLGVSWEWRPVWSGLFFATLVLGVAVHITFVPVRKPKREGSALFEPGSDDEVWYPRLHAEVTEETPPWSGRKLGILWNACLVVMWLIVLVEFLGAFSVKILLH